VVVCVTHPRWFGSDDAPDWWLDLLVVHAALPKRRPPLPDGSRRPDGLEGHPAFEEIEQRDEPFVHAPIARHRGALGLDVASWPRSRTLSARRSSPSSTPCSPAAASTRSRSPTAPSCGSLGAGQRQRRTQILGQRRADVDRRPGHRVREGQPRRVQELALEAQPPRRPVLGIADDG
jgi:hypothetical protein